MKHGALAAFAMASALASCNSLAAAVLKPDVQAAPVNVPAGDYTLDKAHASILFKIDHLGYSTYVGRFERFDTRTEQHQDVSVYPENSIGDAAKNLRERFQWTFPIVFSPHDSATMYTTSQHVWKSTDEGMSWTRISDDLTRNDTTRLQASGGPITKDNTGVEVYCTIFAFAESPVKAGVLWAGSDDGKVHVSTD